MKAVMRLMEAAELEDGAARSSWPRGLSSRNGDCTISIFNPVLGFSCSVNSSVIITVVGDFLT